MTISHETFVRTPVGTDATIRPVNFPVVSLRIDNPSGSWLRIDGPGLQFPNQYVAPYTIGRQLTLPYPVPEVVVRFVAGPAGQVSTRSGDPVTIWAYDYATGDSAGESIAFVTRSDQPERLTTLFGFLDITNSGGVSYNTPAAGATKRYRLYSVAVEMQDVATRLHHHVNLSTGATGIYRTATIGPNKSSHTFDFGSLGVDLVLNDLVSTHGAVVDWANAADNEHLVVVVEAALI